MTTQTMEEALIALALAHGWVRYAEVDGPEGDEEPADGVELLGQTDETLTWGRLDDEGLLLVAPYMPGSIPTDKAEKDRREALLAVLQIQFTEVPDFYAQCIVVEI